jgi:hypothetical protein
LDAGKEGGRFRSAEEVLPEEVAAEATSETQRCGLARSEADGLVAHDVPLSRATAGRAEVSHYRLLAGILMAVWSQDVPQPGPDAGGGSSRACRLHLLETQALVCNRVVKLVRDE